MKSEYRFFALISGFLFVVAALYAWWTDADSGRIEWIGVVALILSGLLCLMCAGSFWMVSRRIDPRPEDRPDAEIADGAGEIGFFSPGSYYPFGLAAAAAVASIGLAMDMWWLVTAGATAILIATGGLVFEYYTGTRRAE
jgi:heme A synthase